MDNLATFNGREMQQHLAQLGIYAQKVVRKRFTQCFTADFFVPNLQDPVAPAQSWAQAIRQSLGRQITIVQVSDTRAEWRPNQPVIAASVTFEVVP